MPKPTFNIHNPLHSWNLPQFIKEDLSFQIFQEGGGVQTFANKKGGVGKIGGCFKRKDYDLFSY